MLEPPHGFSHQFRRTVKVPLRVRDMDMAEVGGPDREEAFRILVRPIPRYERVRCESVSHVVETWTITIGYAAQTDLPGHRVKSSMNFSTIQAIALAGNEQIGGNRPTFPMTFASSDVIGKYFASRRVQRHES